ncbi:MAG: AHH domain-containing protein [Vicinamibacterales bacterium]
MAGHTEGAERGKFCSLRVEPCPCGNKYTDIMSGTGSWGKYPQKHRVLKAVERSPEAHHVLPVASVTAEITANSKIKDEVVKNTQWCVNDKANMIALPLFEMTFLHYIINEEDSAPPFEGLPMHNYDHGAFQDEVDAKLKKIGNDAQANTKAHEDATKELKGALDSLRDAYNPKLASRGKRGKGTHGEFVNAMKDPDAASAEEWYVPFSMADDPDPRPFPRVGLKSGLSKKLKDLQEAFEAFAART